MRERTKQVEVERVEPQITELEQFASYEDGDGVVICDRKAPNAWVRSDTTARIEP